MVALVLLGAWLLWRSRRVRLARLVAEQRDAEHAAFLALAVCGAQLLVGGVHAAVARPGSGAALVPALPCAVRADGLGAAARAASRAGRSGR